MRRISTRGGAIDVDEPLCRGFTIVIQMLGLDPFHCVDPLTHSRKRCYTLALQFPRKVEELNYDGRLTILQLSSAIKYYAIPKPCSQGGHYTMCEGCEQFRGQQSESALTSCVTVRWGIKMVSGQFKIIFSHFQTLLLGWSLHQVQILPTKACI